MYAGLSFICYTVINNKWNSIQWEYIIIISHCFPFSRHTLTEGRKVPIETECRFQPEPNIKNLQKNIANNNDYNDLIIINLVDNATSFLES